MKKAPLTFKYRGTAGMGASEIEEAASALAGYRKRLSRITGGGYETPESLLNLPSDRSVTDAVTHAFTALGDTKKIQHVVLVGIGGSILGTEAVIKALRYPHIARAPQLHTLDTLSTQTLTHIEAVIQSCTESEEIALVIVSKSGKTVETVANAECAFALLAKKFGQESASKRVLVASDLDSPLMSAAEEHNWGRAPIPKTVGGRFSVFSAAGLLPLTLLGADTEALLEGAASVRDTLLEEEGAKDTAVQSAAFLLSQYKKGIHINNHFFFGPELSALGAWYRQLFAESLGKAKTLDGKEVHFGMTPEIAIGSNDLHSVAQLYFGGPVDRATTFIAAGRTEKITLPEEKDRVLPELFSEVSGTPLSDLSSALLEGTKAAYKDAGMPYVECMLSDVSEKAIGAFMMWKMLEVMYLAQLIGVNAFDQPEVERYKAHAQALFSA